MKVLLLVTFIISFVHSMDAASNYTVEPLGTLSFELGEGPHWNEQQSALYFVDAFSGHLHRYEISNGSLSKHDQVNLTDLATIVIPIEGDEQNVLTTLRNKVKTIFVLGCFCLSFFMIHR